MRPNFLELVSEGTFSQVALIAYRSLRSNHIAIAPIEFSRQSHSFLRKGCFPNQCS